MAVASDGSYGIPEGLVYSFPVTCANGDYQIVRDLTIDEFSQSMMNATREELEEERDMVKHLFA
jgi:malate dehydrogenase